MLKIKGKEFPVSLFKVYMHDEILDRLEWIKKHLKIENNVETFAAVVNSVYTQLQTLDEYYKKGAIDEEKK